LSSVSRRGGGGAVHRRFAESANGATLNSISGSIKDSSANSWTLVADGSNPGFFVVYENAAPAGFTAAVQVLFYWYTSPVGHTVYQQNSAGSLYYWDNVSAWVGPVSDPRIVAGAAKRTEDWRLFLAVNTHLPNPGIPDADPALVGPAMNYLNIVTMRSNNTQAIGVSGAITTYNNMAVTVPGLRVQLCFYYSDVNGGTIANGVTNLMTLINGIESAHPGTIIAVEGPNEADISGDSNLVGWSSTQSTRIANANTAQSQMYTAVKAAYPTKEVQLWGLGSQGNSTAQGNQSAICDSGSVHDYVCGQYDQDIYPNVQNNYVNIVTTVNAIGKPWISGEFGFPINPLSGIASQGTNTDVQCRMALSQHMDHWILGAKRSCYYNLIDDNSVGDDYGMFTSTGTPRPFATALKNMISIMLDGGATKLTFVPGALPVNLTNQQATGRSALLQKSNGTFYLVLWASPQIWNGFTQTAVAATPTTVAATFTGTPNFSTVRIYDPMAATPLIQTINGPNINSASVSVLDHPMIIECIP